MIEFTEDEKDAFGEIFNIGVGYAAESLSRMINDRVVLSIPQVTIIPRGEVVSRDVMPDNRMCGVVQRFEGVFDADALLMFPEERSLELVRLMVGDKVSVEEMDELEQEALTEVGNVILNSCVSVISDTLGSGFKSDLPEFTAGHWQEMLPTIGSDDQDVVLMLSIDFHVERHQLRGYLLFLMRLASLKAFKTAIGEYVAGFG